MPAKFLTGADLPAAAVEQILLLLAPEDRAAASATCRTWRAIEVSSRLLYGDVTLDGASLTPSDAERRASSVGSWLAARLEAIQHFKLWTPYPLDSLASGVVDLLASANKLMSLQYVSSDRNLPRALGSLAKLTSLRALQILVPRDGGAALALRARDIAKLKPLRELRAVRLSVAEIRGGLPLPLLKAWSRLESLAIAARFHMAGGDLRHLTSLRALELEGVTLDPPDESTAAGLTALTHLSLTPAPEDAASWQELAVWTALARLPALTSLRAAVDVLGVLAAGAGAPGGVSGDPAEDRSRPPVALVTADALLGGVSVPEGILACRRLQALALPALLSSLPELRPGQLPRLTSLDLSSCMADRLPGSWCTALPGLTRLALNGAPALAAALPRELEAMPVLTVLELRACGLTLLPEPVAALGTLRRLDLGINRLAGLPRGARCLRRLTWLGLRQNAALEELPPALEVAAELQELDLRGCESLSLGTCAQPLHRLTQLRRLLLGRGRGWLAPPDTAALASLAAAAPGLVVLTLDDPSQDHYAEAEAAATAAAAAAAAAIAAVDTRPTVAAFL